ncbi:DUF4190 domain-containing protein [Microcella alkaliphila]|jgi:ABC-type Fe3+ transport system permease subunit|uniref:DUF4190 domain-containing protein n=1 Tax=Microcella alkaliphila TaxID=279828 RepID=A0A0U4WTE2_9MICO|nr:DUF4190 domain-containing protein [Microcella alkaliphila]BAU31160.1 uncharacterized protein MalAC0309_0285 [Microcella alkaliphila]
MTDAPPPAYSQPAQPAVNPGQTLGIVALILAFVAPLVGLILGVVALNQSKKVGMKNGLAVASIWLGAIFTVFWTILTIVAIVLPILFVGSIEGVTTFAP